jgi:hypothetical protein
VRYKTLRRCGKKDDENLQNHQEEIIEQKPSEEAEGRSPEGSDSSIYLKETD